MHEVSIFSFIDGNFMTGVIYVITSPSFHYSIYNCLSLFGCLVSSRRLLYPPIISERSYHSINSFIIFIWLRGFLEYEAHNFIALAMTLRGFRIPCLKCFPPRYDTESLCNTESTMDLSSILLKGFL